MENNDNEGFLNIERKYGAEVWDYTQYLIKAYMKQKMAEEEINETSDVLKDRYKVYLAEHNPSMNRMDIYNKAEQYLFFLWEENSPYSSKNRNK